MTKAILQQALDALEWASNLTQAAVDYRPLQNTITALREALAAPMPEPVHQFRLPFCADWYDGHPDPTITGPYETRTLYATPQPAPAVPDGVPDTSLVICPNCCTQFRAIPQDVQRLMIDAGFEPPFVAAPVVPLTDDMVEAEFVRRGDDKGQGLHPYWKDAFREGFNFAKSQLSAAPVVREQLTNGEIYTAYIAATNQTLRPQDERLALAFARAIEKAHGITGGGNG